MTGQESQVILARIDGLQATIAKVEADVLRLDDRQREAANSLARLEATAGTVPPPAPLVPIRTQAAATGGLVAVMLALVEVIRMLAVGG